MKLPYLGAYHSLLAQLDHRFVKQDQSWPEQPVEIAENGRITASVSVGAACFHFQQAAPSMLKGHDWQLQPLQMANAALTYEAYLTNPDIPLRHGHCQTYTWRDHVSRVEQIEEEHRACKHFSFALLSTGQEKCLGCLHLSPLRPFLVHHNAPDYLLATTGENSAMVLYWIGRFHREPLFCGQLIQALCHWFDQVWELEGYLFRVKAEDFTAVHTLQTAGLRLRCLTDLADLPGQYAFYGN